MSDEQDQGEMADRSAAAPRSAPKTPTAEAPTAAPPTAEVSGQGKSGPGTGTPAGGASESLEQDSIESLLRQAESGVAEAAGETSGGAAHAAAPSAFELGELEAGEPHGPGQSIDLLGDVELDLRIELGRTLMRLEDVLQLRGGSVVVLDKLAGDPVDIYVNGRLVARGEVLVMNDNFCIRVTELAGTLA